MDSLEQERQRRYQSQSNNAAQYVLHGRAGLPGVMSKEEFNEQRALYKPKRNFSQFDLLQKVLNRVEQNPPKKGLTVSFTGASTWNDVFKVANEARTAYQRSGNMFHRIGRSAGNNASAVLAGLSCIPENDYTSILCSGLKFIFGVALNVAQSRERIMIAFDNIPETIGRVEVMTGIYGNDTSFQEATEKLYGAVILAIIRSIEWLVGTSAWKKTFEAFLKGSQVGKPVDTLLNEVQKCSSRVFDLTNDLDKRCLAGMSNDMDKIAYGVRALQVVSQDSRRGIANIESQTTSISSSLSTYRGEVQVMSKTLQDQNQEIEGFMKQALLDQQQVIDRTLADYQREMEAFLDHQRRAYDEAMKKAQLAAQVDARFELTNGMIFSFVEHVRKLECAESREARRPRVLSQHHLQALPVSLISQAQLFTCIDITSDSEEDESPEHLARACHNFDTPRTIAAQGVLVSSEFRSWLLSKQSQIFLVDGSVGSGNTWRTTPMTSLLASLVLTCWDDPSTTVLHFFCGAHANRNHPLAGPVGVIRSLIRQLLLKPQYYRLDFINTDQYCDALAVHHLPALCHTFANLVMQLEGDVMCLIDGMCLYETPPWENELQQVLECLIQVVEDDMHKSCCFKLLMTTPSRSLQIIRRIETLPRAQVLDARYLRGSGRLMSQREMMEVSSEAEKIFWRGEGHPNGTANEPTWR